jgi:hypothetical protein
MMSSCACRRQKSVPAIVKGKRIEVFFSRIAKVTYQLNEIVFVSFDHGAFLSDVASLVNGHSVPLEAATV